MFKMIKESIEWNGCVLSLETGKIARQANGSVVVSYGDTTVLVTVVVGQVKEDVDFLPLTVQFVAKSYAAGKIPGGFFKREGKPSERETLISRLIDRSIRPLFPEGFYNEVSVICNLLTYDMINVPEVPALVGAAAALAISGLPLNGSIAGARVGCCFDKNNNCNYMLNPSVKEMSSSNLDLFLSGNEDSILMVESEANELSEDQMLEAIKYGHEKFQDVIKFIKNFASKVGKNSTAFISNEEDEGFVDGDNANSDDLIDKIKEEYQNSFILAYKNVEKKGRVKALNNVRSDILKAFTEKGQDEQFISCAIKSFERTLVRNMIISTGKRIDGRSATDIRSIGVEANTLPITHGSALFTRGNTQALVVATLGTTQDEQIVDDLEGNRREHFMLHYNFPPYAVGESTALRAPGRREIGHGKLAERAIRAILPGKADFPYTIRLVSEITESDGSSSMATVCGASLALMESGVPIKSAVAGIAMGLIKEENNSYAVLSDILGDEDYLGDMDFKVAGTRGGITALQMDMKIFGISFDIIKESLAQAKDGRFYIMDKMDDVKSKPNDNLKENAPKMMSMVIDENKIRNVIGTGGKNIKDIQEKCKAVIDIQGDGAVTIFALTTKLAKDAKEMIVNIIADPKVGVVYEAKITKIEEYIAHAEFLGSKQGRIHISEIANKRISSMHDHLSIGKVVRAVVIGVERDRFKLSMRRVDQETGELFESELYEAPKSFSRDRDNSSDYEHRSSRKYDSSRGKPSFTSNRSRNGNSGNSRFGGGNVNNPRKPKIFT
ncbi:polyribonucleotide nucleotidyltransferase [Candidatus Mesenet endosymbiont of Agriotes lineatus]|uniref:polyribonucleotide nucleotidyltransferase n=1 Tax=Candidatus Mesenet endosymbiont of Agriotes lineatus TaxID=3077948 RepID=UPI0030D61CF0